MLETHGGAYPLEDLAPVTDGRLPGRPASDSRASHAKAIASTSLTGTPYAAVVATARGARPDASTRNSAPLCAPPPHTSTSDAPAQCDLIASTIVAEVRASNVRWTSAGACSDVSRASSQRRLK